MSGARYMRGDDFTEADFVHVGGRAQHGDGKAFASAIEDLLPGRICCVPAHQLTSPTPTTVGLGDTFVGGFVAALVGSPECRSGERL